MPVRGVGPGVVRHRGDDPHVEPNAGNAGVRDVDNRVAVDDAGRTDRVDRTGGTSSGTPAGAITGPYAALAKRGDFSGYVVTSTGQELFVTVRVAKKDPGKERPLVYLDGLAARRSRSDMMADKFRDEAGRTVISILLPGQGETLLRDLTKNRGKSLDRDLADSGQADAVIAALDALGVDKPVDIFGLSYGGAIAAATERDHESRIENVLLVAPHVRSQARDQMGELSWQMMNSPWNPMGNSMYRSAAKATLGNGFPLPELFKDHPDAFPEALFRLSMGIDRNELQTTTRGLDNIHVLVAEGDPASPRQYNEAAIENASSGSFTLAPDAFKGMHDLVSASPEMVVLWVTQKLSPERLDDVTPVLEASMKKRLVLETAMAMMQAAAKGVVDSTKLAPAECAKAAAEAGKLAAAAAKGALDAVPDHGQAALEIADMAAKIAAEAAKVVAVAAQAAPSTESQAAVVAAAAYAKEAAKSHKAAAALVDGG